MAGRPPLARCERIVFRVDAASATPARPVVLEVQFLAEGRRARWWRKVELDRPGWREVDLPLDAFRTGGGPPSWEEVDRLGFLFRTGATLGLDGIELRPGRRPGRRLPVRPRAGPRGVRGAPGPRPPPRAVRRRDRRAPARRGEAARRPGGHVRAGPGPTCRACRPPRSPPRSWSSPPTATTGRSGRDSPAASGPRWPRRVRGGSPPWGSPPPRPRRTRPRPAPSSSTRRRTP